MVAYLDARSAGMAGLAIAFGFAVLVSPMVVLVIWLVRRSKKK